MATGVVEPGEPFHHRGVGTGLGRQPEAHVVPVAGIGAPIPVEAEAARPNAVRVSAWLPFQNWNRGDAEGHLGQDCGFEDALGADEWDASVIQGEASGEDGTREDLAVQLGLVSEEAEGC